MQVIQVEILDPEAEKLLQDLAEKEMIAIHERFDEGDGIAKLPRYFGCGKGEMTILPSFDEPLEEFKEYE